MIDAHPSTAKDTILDNKSGSRTVKTKEIFGFDNLIVSSGHRSSDETLPVAVHRAMRYHQAKINFEPMFGLRTWEDGRSCPENRVKESRK